MESRSTLPSFGSQESPSKTKMELYEPSPSVAKTFFVIITLPLYLFALNFYLAIACKVPNQ